MKTKKKILCFALIFLAPVVAFSQGRDSVRVGLCLSGGAAMGYVHIGVLQAFEEAGLEVDVISGTSMGAIIGLFYAAGYSPQEMLAIVRREKMDKVRHIVRNNWRNDAGYADYRFLRRMIYKYMPHNHFDSLSIPYYCCVTNLNHGRSEYVGHGPLLAQYVTASASIPMIFAPVEINGQTYVDGWVLNDLPIEPLLMEGCDVTIGSYLAMDTAIVSFKKNYEIWGRVAGLFMRTSSINRLRSFDHLIANDCHGLQLYHFDHVDDFYRYGYEAARQMLSTDESLRALCRTPFPQKNTLRRPEE